MSDRSVLRQLQKLQKEGDATTLLLHLPNEIVIGDEVTIEYISGSIESADDGMLQSFGPVHIYNDVSASALSLPGIIQAEDFTDMFGIQTENTSDEEGGLNVGWIDDGDWLEYYINPQYSGVYMLQLRIASQSAAGRIKITANDNIIGTRSLPVTGGWQTWLTVNQITGFEAGEQILRITAELGGFNLNWLQFDLVTDVSAEAEIPNQYELGQNYPNPFNPATTIEYGIPERGNVLLKVFNTLGEEVASLVNDIKNAGSYKVMFNAEHLPSGIYLLRFSAGSKNYSKKMLLLK